MNAKQATPTKTTTCQACNDRRPRYALRLGWGTGTSAPPSWVLTNFQPTHCRTCVRAAQEVTA
jgi:hypothetical protein